MKANELEALQPNRMETEASNKRQRVDDEASNTYIIHSLILQTGIPIGWIFYL